MWKLLLGPHAHLNWWTEGVLLNKDSRRFPRCPHSITCTWRQGKRGRKQLRRLLKLQALRPRRSSGGSRDLLSWSHNNSQIGAASLTSVAHCDGQFLLTAPRPAPTRQPQLPGNSVQDSKQPAAPPKHANQQTAGQEASASDDKTATVATNQPADHASAPLFVADAACADTNSRNESSEHRDCVNAGASTPSVSRPNGRLSSCANIEMHNSQQDSVSHCTTEIPPEDVNSVLSPCVNHTNSLPIDLSDSCRHNHASSLGTKQPSTSSSINSNIIRSTTRSQTSAQSYGAKSNHRNGRSNQTDQSPRIRHLARKASPKLYLTRCITSASSLADLTSIVTQHAQSFDHIHVAAALCRFPKLAPTSTSIRQDPAVIPLLQHLTQLLSQHLHTYQSARELCNCVWSLGKVQYCPEGVMPAVLAQLLDDGSRRLTNAKPQELSNLAYGLACLNWKGQYSRDIWQAIAASSTACLVQFGPQELSNLVWAMAKAGKYNPALFSDVAASCVTKGMYEFTLQGAVNVAWAFGVCRHTDNALFNCIAEVALHRSHDVGPQALGNLLYSFARVRLVHVPLFHQLLKAAAATPGRLRPQELANVLWSLAVLFKPGNETKPQPPLGATSRPESAQPAAALPVQDISWVSRDLEAVDRLSEEPVTSSQSRPNAKNSRDNHSGDVMLDVASEDPCTSGSLAGVAADDPGGHSLPNTTRQGVGIQLDPEAATPVASVLGALRQPHNHDCQAASSNDTDPHHPDSLQAAVPHVPALAHDTSTSYAHIYTPADVPSLELVSGMPSRTLLNILMHSFSTRLSKFNSVEVAACVWSCAKLNHRDQTVMEATASWVTSNAGKLQPRQACSLMYSFAKLCWWDAVMFNALASLAEARMAELSLQGLANLVWAFGRAHHYHPSLFAAAASRAKRHLDRFSEQELANLLWGFASLHHHDQELFQAAAEHITSNVQHLSAKSIPALAWAYAFVRHCNLTLFEALSQHVAPNLSSLTVHDLAVLCSAFCSMHMDVPALYDAIIKEALSRLRAGKPFDPSDMTSITLALMNIQYPCTGWCSAVATHAEVNFPPSMLKRLSEALQSAPSGTGVICFSEHHPADDGIGQGSEGVEHEQNDVRTLLGKWQLHGTDHVEALGYGTVHRAGSRVVTSESESDHSFRASPSTTQRTPHASLSSSRSSISQSEWNLDDSDYVTDEHFLHDFRVATGTLNTACSDHTESIHHSSVARHVERPSGEHLSSISSPASGWPRGSPRHPGDTRSSGTGPVYTMENGRAAQQWVAACCITTSDAPPSSSA